MRRGVYAIVGLFLACGDGLVSFEDDGVLPGVIDYFDFPIEIDVPTQAMTTVPIAVRIRTYWEGGHCVSHAETHVTFDGRSMVVSPYNRVGAISGVLCILPATEMIDHIVKIPLVAEGEWKIVVRGWRLPRDMPFEQDFTVNVIQSAVRASLP